MAIRLQSKPNVVAPGAPYPYGRIKDRVPSVSPGTPVNEVVYGDFHQFFAKLLDDAGITGNDLPENSTNTFQYIIALNTIISAAVDPLNDSTIVWTTSGLVLGSGVTNTSFKFKKTGRNTVKLTGVLTNAAATGGYLMATLPVGYRPSVRQTIPIASFGFLGGPGWTAVIEINGEITIYENNYVSGAMGGGQWSLDAIEFEL